MAETGAPPRAADMRVLAEAGRRRAFAVISHPDAGKSTLTEALALHASAITQAGAVHGKAGRRGTVSDWMEMEQKRGISITSAALQFPFGVADLAQAYRALDSVFVVHLLERLRDQSPVMAPVKGGGVQHAAEFVGWPGLDRREAPVRHHQAARYRGFG